MFQLSGGVLYENSAQCSTGMQNQFDLVKGQVIGGCSYREFTVLTIRSQSLGPTVLQALAIQTHNSMYSGASKSLNEDTLSLALRQRSQSGEY